MPAKKQMNLSKIHFIYSILYKSIIRSLWIFSGILLLANCSGRQIKEDARFSYKNVYKDRYKNNGKGGIIPLTLEKGETYAGTITPDGKYLFFTSNRWDNYDIFFRPLDDVKIIPVVSSATNQKEPAISPNGKYLIYIDDELDPDGDLIYEKIDIDDLIEKFEEGEDPNEKGFLSKRENLTNDEKKRVRSRESNPVWSHNGKKIAFSSDMTSIEGNPFGPGIGAVQNIWIMDPDSKKSARKLTEKGGVMPNFSPNDRRIVFIAYRDRYSRGNIYIIDTQSKKEKQLTFGNDMYLNPSYSPDGKSIIATRISKDTNEDGYIDRKDNGQIVELSLNEEWFKETSQYFSEANNSNEDKSDNSQEENTDTSENQAKIKNYFSTIELTLENENIFDTKISGFIGGSIIFAQGVGENINVTMIPRHGIIPEKKTIEEQYSFTKSYLNEYEKLKNADANNSVENEENDQEIEKASLDKAARKYLLSLQKIKDLFHNDPLFPLYEAKKDIDAYLFLSKERIFPEHEKAYFEKIEQELKSNSSSSNLYSIILFYESKGKYAKWIMQSSLYRYIEKGSSFPDFIQSEKENILQYYTKEEESIVQSFAKLNNITLKNPDSSEEQKTLTENNNTESTLLTKLNEKQQKEWNQYKQNANHSGENIYYYFKEKSGDYLYNENDMLSSREEYQGILKEFPDYYRKFTVIKKFGESSSDYDIPNAYLHVLYPSKHNLTQKEKDTEEQIGSYEYNEEEKSEIQYLVYNIFRKNLLESRSGINESILKKYNQEDYPDLFYISGIANSEYYLDQGDPARAEKEIQTVQKLIPENTFWQYKYHFIMGGIEEIRKNMDIAFGHYNSSVLLYKNSYNDEKFVPMIRKFLSYYESKGETYKKRKKYKKAWKYYKFLGNIYLQLGAKKILPDLVKQKAMETFIDINSMTLRSIGSDNEIIEDVTQYYDKNIDFARRYLLNFFIFSRAHLNTQTGILLHTRFEKDELREKEKEKVFKRFKTAETDFQWSFFADQYFAESYILLGWMYQYIDEKRELIVDKKNDKKDKDKFSDLYKKYFPSYLFEENIRLYQKSISYFSNKINPGILASFYLNIGNNYFLLNNYHKAREYYSKLEKITNYQFESDTQKANFYFHSGKTYYFTGDYEKSVDSLKKAYNMYQKIAPLNLNHKKSLSKNLNKRIIIMKYLAIASEYAGNNQESIDWYNEIIRQQNFVGSWEDRSIFALEKARLYKDMDNYEMSLFELKETKKALKKEEEVIAPTYPIRIKWFGIYQPWTWLLSKVYTLDYDFVYVGDNHLAFNLPTVNRRQMYHSMKADILFKKGLYGVAIKELKNLIKYAEKDESSHGKETLVSAYMRIGEAYFKVNSLENSEKFYKKALELSSENNYFTIQRKARKNLLTIYAYSIENTDKTAKEKLENTNDYIKDTKKFINQYIEAKIELAEEAQQEKNSDLELSQKEKEEVIETSVKEIYQIILYQAVFETFKGNLHKEINKNTTSSVGSNYVDFINKKKKVYSYYSNAIQTFSGEFDDYSQINKPITIWDKKLARKTIMISRMNKSIIFDQLDLTEKAIQNNQEIYDEAVEFQTFYPLAITSYNLYLNAENHQEALEYLKESYRILIQNPNLIEYNPELFKRIYSTLSIHLFDVGEYQKALEIQNESRHILSSLIILPALSSVELSSEKFQEFIETEYFLKNQKILLNEEIEKKRLSREDSSELEKDLESLEKDRQENQKALQNDKETNVYYNSFFKNSIKEISLFNQIGNYLYTFSNNDQMYFIYRKDNQLEGKSLSVTELKKINWEDNLSDASSEEKSTEIKQEANSDTPKILTHPFKVWYKSLDPSIVFVDENMINKSILPDLSRPKYITIQEALLFQNRHSIASTNWIQVKSQSGIMSLFGGSTTYNLPIEMRIAENEEILKDNRIWGEVLDYELQLDKSVLPVNRNDISMANFLSMKHEFKTGIISYNEIRSLNFQDKLLYSSAVNLILGASGFNEVYHFYQKREDSKSNIESIINGNEPSDQLYLFTGNANLSKHRKFVKQPQKENTGFEDINNYKKNYYSYFDQKFQFYYELSRRYQNEKSNQLALDAIVRSRNIQKHWKELNPTRKLQGESSYSSIFLELYYKTNAKNEIKDQFFQQTMKSLEKEEDKLDFSRTNLEFQLLYTSETVNEAVLNNFANTYTPSEKDFYSLLESYILGRIKKGYLSLPINDPIYQYLLEKSNYPQEDDLTLDKLYISLMKNTKYPEKWNEFFLESGYFEKVSLQFDKNIQTSNILKRNLIFKSILKMKLGLSKNNSAERSIIPNEYLKFLDNPNADNLLKIENLNLPDLEKEYAYFTYYITINNQTSMLQSLDNIFQIMEEEENKKIDVFIINVLVAQDLLNMINGNSLTINQRENIYSRISTIGEKYSKTSQLNFQQKIFYTYLTYFEEREDHIQSIPDVISKNNVKDLSSINQSLLNNYYYQTMIDYPEKLSTTSYMQVNIYKNDEMILDRLKYLQSFSQKPQEYYPTNTWQKNINFTFFYNQKKYDQALKHYYYYDTGIKAKDFQKYDYNISGLVDTYAGNYYLWSITDSIKIEKFQVENVDEDFKENIINLIKKKKSNTTYLPRKEFTLKNLGLDNEITLYTVRIESSDKKENIVNDVVDNVKNEIKDITKSKDYYWVTDSDYKHPGYSILSIQFGKKYNKIPEGDSDIIIELVTNKITSKNSDIIFWEPLSDQNKIIETTTKKADKTHQFYFFMYLSENKNVFYNFMNFYTEFLRKNKKPREAFINASEKIKDQYPASEDHNSIIMVQN